MKRLTLLLLIIALALFVIPAYADMDDKSDRLSNEQSNVFSPGYINMTSQKTREIINQVGSGKGLHENAEDYWQKELAGDITDKAQERVAPELKQKKGTQEAASASGKAVIDGSSVNYNVNIGSGTAQVWEGGKLISETIDGTRHVYVGFANAGKSTIQGAMDIANVGDMIIVRGGDYNAFNMANGVTLYGGYRDDGVRDIAGAATRIYDVFDNSIEHLSGSIFAVNLDRPTEINGIEIIGPSYQAPGVLIRNCKSLKVSNTIFENKVFGMVAWDSTVISEDNDFQSYGVWGNNSNIYLARNNFTNQVYFGEDKIKMENVMGFNSKFYYDNNEFVERSGFSKGFFDSTSKTYERDYTVKATAFTMSATSTNLAASDINKGGAYENAFSQGNFDRILSLGGKYENTMTGDDLTNIFKGLLVNKETMAGPATGTMDPQTLVKLINEGLGESALAIPLGEMTAQEMEIASNLASILRNPTDAQKAVIDTAIDIMNAVNGIQQDSGSPELKKATDDLLQMVATILIAQAIPDLLGEGDVASIKGVFSDLGTSKERIMLGYQESVKPYYREVVKDLANNMSALQSKNILSNKITKEELDKLPRSEIDKILQKLRAAKDKSFEEEYILQQEAKYRKAYIEPNKRVLEEKMKTMMKEFTQRLSGILEGTKK